MCVLQHLIKISFILFAALSALMWWRSANVPNGEAYDCGFIGEVDPYITYYNKLKWWQKQFFPIRYPENQFFADGISKDFNRYAAMYACIATLISIIDSLLSFATQ